MKPGEWTGRATRAEVDLDILAANVRALIALLPPPTRLMAVVKANAYGHGAFAVAKTALAAGADMLAVATLGEARRLHRQGISGRILVLAPVDPREITGPIEAGIELAISDLEVLDALLRTQSAAAEPLPLHLKIDTGLHRSGANPELAFALAKRIVAADRVSLAGLFTHFATADEADESFAREQAALLAVFRERLQAAGIEPVSWHQANSGGILHGLSGNASFARAGIAMYGVSPSPETPIPTGIRPVLALKTRVEHLVPLHAGDPVGYGRTWRASGEETGVLAPLGYGDGLPRRLEWSGVRWVSVNTVCP